MRVRSRREKKDETRKKLFRVAVALFGKHGYQATTVDAIAAEAGVAKGTFFFHFPSKDAVITELVRIQTQAAREARAQKKSPVDKLRATVMTLGQHGALSRTLSRAVLNATLESQDVGGEAAALFDELFAEMTSDARAAKRAGLLGPVDADTLAASLIASYLGALVSFVTRPRSVSLVEILAPLVEETLAGARRRG